MKLAHWIKTSLLGLSLVLLAAPAIADTIEIVSAGLTGNSWEAVLDGGFNGNGPSGFTPDPHGGYPGNSWGQYQERGWLATKWQTMETGPYAGDYLWIDNFNVLDAIGQQPPIETKLYTASEQLDIYVLSSSQTPGHHGNISDDEILAATNHGIFTLTSIVFSESGSTWNPSETLRHGALTLNGQISFDGSSQVFDVSWTLGDFSNGNPSVITVLNSVTGKPQIHLDGVGPSYANTPEPGTLLLLGSAMSGLWAYRRRRRQMAKLNQSPTGKPIR